MMTLQTTIYSKRAARPTDAFTLAEILVVLTILAVMAGIALPYAANSASFHTLRQESLNLLTAAQLALDYAAQTNSPARLLLHTKSPAYEIQTASSDDPDTFLPLPGPAGQLRSLGPGFTFPQTDGFTARQQSLALTFDPQKPWPSATLTVVYKHQSKTISISGQKIELTHENQND